MRKIRWRFWLTLTRTSGESHTCLHFEQLNARDDDNDDEDVEDDDECLLLSISMSASA